MSSSIFRAIAGAVGLVLATTVAVGCSPTKNAAQDAATSVTSAASSVVAGGTATLYYPDEQDAMFSITAPSGWTVGKIDKVGDFGSIESKNGSVLQFRGVKYETEAEAREQIDAIADSTTGFLNDNYTDITLDEPKDVTVNGQPAAQLSGTGKDKDGNAVTFLSAIVVLGPRSLAEVWAAVVPGGGNDLEAATAVLNSFTVAR